MEWTLTRTVQSGCESLEFGPGLDPKKVELDTLHIFTLWKTFPDNTNLIKNT